MNRDHLPLFGGAIRANRIGSFVKGGETFHIIRPGYCAQGKRRTAWTQIVHGDVPVFAVKVSSTLPQVLERFEREWAKWVGDDAVILNKALDLCKNLRRRTFRDGVAGESPAPAVSVDGRSLGVRYSA